MKNPILLILLGAVMLGASCKHAEQKQTTIVSTGASKTDTLVTDVKTLPSVVDEKKALENQRLSKIAASNEVIWEDAKLLPVSNEQMSLSAESGIITSLLQGVEVSPQDRADAQTRKKDYWKGEYAAAEAGRQAALSQAEQAKLRLDETTKLHDATVAALVKQAGDAQIEIANSRSSYIQTLAASDRKVNEANQRASAAELKAKKERDTMLSRVILGLSSLCFLAGAGLIIATQGRELIRGLIAIGCSATGFSMYWAFNQPWFKYVVIAGVGLIVAAVIGLIVFERHQMTKKLVLKERSAQADEAEDTLHKMLDVLDDMPETDPLFPLLRDKLNDANKALLNELRAEKQRLQAAPVKTV